MTFGKNETNMLGNPIKTYEVIFASLETVLHVQRKGETFLKLYLKIKNLAEEWFTPIQKCKKGLTPNK